MQLHFLWVENNLSRKCSEFRNISLSAPTKIGFDIINFLALETDVLALFHFALNCAA